ncbi:tetratricopeptide repeat protein, partial [candidate division WOR-3 bacterium]|nr:tetratricopeptide repeat protein [candidate division WOR-3 bacterium]
IRPGQVLNFTVKLQKKLTPDMLSSLELTQKALEDYKNKKYKEARSKLNAALQLYPDNEKAKEGLQLVEKTIQGEVRSLKEQARSQEAVNLEKAIALWQEVLYLEPRSEVEVHIQELRSRLASLTKPKPKKKPAPAKKKPTLSAAQIENFYKKGIKEYVQGNYREAANYFQKILDANPNHESAKRYLKKAKEKL